MSKRKTHEEYVKELATINSNIEVIDTYVNAKTPICHKCKIDNYEWMGAPTNLLRGKGCPKCAGNIKKTHEEYVEEVKLINPTINIIEEYIDAKTKILHKCNIDNTEWYAAPDNILAGKGCPSSKNQKIAAANRMSQTEYIGVVNFYHPDIEVIGEYLNSRIKIAHQCKLCGYQWDLAPHSLKHILGCPLCGDGISYPNKFMYALLKQININFIPEYFADWSNQKRYDIYIPSINCIIENHGRQHYEECFFFNHSLEEEQKNDMYKQQLAIANGVVNYVALDCRKSTTEWIKESVMNSKLPLLLNFSDGDISWNKCETFATCSLIKKTADYWNSGQSIKNIAIILNLHVDTIRRYLQRASINGWCVYNPKEGHKRAGILRSGSNSYRAQMVFCVEKDKIFKCIKDATEIMGVNSSQISACCRGVRHTTGGYHWYYINDYIKKDGTVIPGAVTLGLILKEDIDCKIYQ